MTNKRIVPALGFLALVLASGFMFAFPELASAGVEDTIASGITSTATAADYDTNLSLPTLIGNLIQALLGLTGMVFLVMTVYAGGLYMTAAGDDAKVKKAKSMIATSVVGLIIIIAAYAITSFLITAIANANSGAE